LERGRPGQPYNVVDDEPVNWRDFTWVLADTFDTPKPWELPLPVLRLVAPYLAVMMTSTLRASNARARRDLGWTPSMPTYRDGVRRTTTAPREAA
jgi:nucleoside-diphosphate-sugar epimerase